jgi:hypothetical protein
MFMEGLMDDPNSLDLGPDDGAERFAQELYDKHQEEFFKDAWSMSDDKEQVIDLVMEQFEKLPELKDLPYRARRAVLDAIEENVFNGVY